MPHFVELHRQIWDLLKAEVLKSHARSKSG